MNPHYRIVFLGAVLLALAAGGLSSMADSNDRSISVTATHTDVLINESTLVSVKSSQSLGSHPSVTWSATLGALTPVKEGSLNYNADRPSAMFISDKPGKSVITAKLVTADGKTLSDTVTITVNPLKP